jgi:hypothetical protein
MRKISSKKPELWAMDEYAKEVAIAFANYKRNYRYLKSSYKWTSDKEDLLTTEELFNQFITSQNP